MKIFVAGDADIQNSITKTLSRLNATIETQNLSPNVDAAIIDADTISFESDAVAKRLKKMRVPCVVLSSQKSARAVFAAVDAGAFDFLVKPFNQRELIMRLNALVTRKLRVTCIGGGTGLFSVLLGLKTAPNTLLTSVVSMSDDGGSSGKLSQTFGILPPGDVRRCLVALSNAPDVMNQIVQYRFDKGELRGHSFGNLFLTVLAEVKGSMSEAVRALSDILNIQGIVLPASHDATKLAAQFSDGTVIRGESRIDLCEGRSADLRVKKLWHEPKAQGASEAVSAILNADVVTIGPGDLFTSVIANLAIEDIRRAVVESPAKKIYVCNLMTKPGETAHFDAADHLREVLKYLKKDCLDAVLVSNTQVSEDAIHDYSLKHQGPVKPGALASLKKLTRAKVVFADIGHETELVRHDSLKLRNEIMRLAKEWKKKK